MCSAHSVATDSGRESGSFKDSERQQTEEEEEMITVLTPPPHPFTPCSLVAMATGPGCRTALELVVGGCRGPAEIKETVWDQWAPPPLPNSLPNFGLADLRL